MWIILGIEIDHKEDRNKHNEKLCWYLTNQEEYNQCIKKISERLVRINKMRVIERSVLRYWLGKIYRNVTIDNELIFLLKQDQRRNIILHSI